MFSTLAVYLVVMNELSKGTDFFFFCNIAHWLYNLVSWIIQYAQESIYHINYNIMNHCKVITHQTFTQVQK